MLLPQKPWSIQISIVKGCDRRCWFCGIHALSKEDRKPNQFIDVDLLRHVFHQLNDWMPAIRVELDHHGEPTAHPEFLTCVRVIREEMPKASIQLQTNSDLWWRAAKIVIPRWWEAGLNVLAINCYAKGRSNWFRQRFHEWGWPYIDYNYQTGESFNTRVRPQVRKIFLLENLAETAVNIRKRGTHWHTNRWIHNSGGNGNPALLRRYAGKEPLAEPLDRRCSKVFREIILNWDGTVPICCQDWKDVHLMGDANHTRLISMWQGEHWQIVRQLLYRKRRDLLEPCRSCDDPTTRVGLVKDPGSPLTDSKLVTRLGEVTRCLSR